MCLLALAIDGHPDYELVVAENRDEFFDRPTAVAGFWAEAPDLLAGRDLERGGSWFGVTRSGRWAVVTNYRDFHHRRYSRLSRGALVSAYLKGDEGPGRFVASLAADDGHYAGLNFIAGDRRRASYISNTGGGCRKLDPGVYALSNHWLDTPWPKVRDLKSEFSNWLDAGSRDTERLFSMLADRRLAADDQLPDTGVGLDWERQLSARFVRGEKYGTRASTIFFIDRTQQATFIERSFAADGSVSGEVIFNFALSRPLDRPGGAG